MERFGSILALLSGGETSGHVHALAVGLARADRAALTFVDVIDTDRPEPSDAGIAMRRAWLAEVAAEAELAGVPASEAVVRGDPAVEVIRMVLREGHDLVLMPADDTHDTASRLLAECPCPVWLVAGERPASVIAITPAAGGEDAARVAAMSKMVSAHLRVDVVELIEGAMPPLSCGGVLVAIRPTWNAGSKESVLALKPEGFVSPVTLDAAPQGNTARGATRNAGKG